MTNLFSQTCALRSQNSISHNYVQEMVVQVKSDMNGVWVYNTIQLHFNNSGWKKIQVGNLIK